MARTEAQKAKLLWLSRFFEEETDEANPATMQDIIAYLDAQGIPAERKGLYRDIALLQDFGYDILQEPRGHYYLGERPFSLPELRLLTDAVQCSKFISEKKSRQFIEKLGGLTSRSQRRVLSRYTSVIRRAKTPNEQLLYTVDGLNEAIYADRQVTFHYFDWTPKKERLPRHGGALYTVSPWLMLWDDAYYYLVAYDAADGRIKHYRADKILDLRIAEARREGREAADRLSPADYSTGVFSMFGGERRTVTLRCADELAGVMLDRFGQDVILVPAEPGFFTLSVPVDVSPQFFGWLAALGGRAALTGPEDVCDDYRRLIRSVLRGQDAVRKRRTDV